MENMECVMMELATLEKNPQVDTISQTLDDYLGYVAKSGNALFAWSKVKPLFKRKLELIIKEFVEESPTENLPRQPNVEMFSFDQMRERIFEQLESYTGVPFTVQRLCELMVEPRKHYKRTDKFMRGLEKIMLVVSTIDPNPNVEKAEEKQETLVKQSTINGERSSCFESPSKRMRLDSGDHEPGPCDSADDTAGAGQVMMPGEAGPSGVSSDQENNVDTGADTGDDSMDIDTECSSSEVKLSVAPSDPESDETGVASSESAAPVITDDAPGDAESSSSVPGGVASMEVEDTGAVEPSDGVSTSVSGEVAGVEESDTSGASSSGDQDTVSDQSATHDDDTSSREAEPAESTPEDNDNTGDTADTNTDDQMVGNSDETVDAVESSQDTSQQSSAGLTISQTSGVSGPGAADSSDEAKVATESSEASETSAECDNEVTNNDNTDQRSDESSSVSQSEPSTSDNTNNRDDNNDDNSPDTSSSSAS